MTEPLIRAARESDMGFVVDTWRQSFRDESYLFKFNRDLYFRLMGMHVGGLMKTGEIRVACNPADEDTIIGFAAHTGRELHYVYVREALRKHGVARALIESLPIATYSFSTGAFMRRIKPVERGWIFKPRTEQSSNGKFSVEMG
jgi:GNAT superfamily N-acetyltransferase